MHHDHRFIEALRRNDESLIREIYRQHQPAMLRWIQSRGGSSEDARDIFQDALTAVFEKAQHPEFILTCPLGALLHVICSRKWVDRLRQKNKDLAVRNETEHRFTETDDADTISLAEAAMAEQAHQTRLNRAFEQLSAICRQLLTLLGQGVAPRDAAAELQMNSVDTLYRRKNACIERWRDLYHQSSGN